MQNLKTNRLLVLFAAFFFFAACTGSGGGRKGNTLYVGNGTELETLDPNIVTGAPEHRVIIALFDGLFNYDPKTNEPVPGLAESHTLSKDLKTYTFKLRPNAKWTDGVAVVASDFVYSWKRLLTAALGAENAYMLYPVVNAEEYHLGKVKDFSQVGVKALDPQTLEVKLRSPTPYFLGLLTHQSTIAVPPHVIEKMKAQTDRNSRWVRPETFVGNGPFKLVKWELNKVIRVEKNPLYWDAANTKLDAIEFYPVESVQTEERMYRAGNLDITGTIPINKVSVYQQERPDETFISPSYSTYVFRVNVRKPQLKDARVRRALAMAIDRNALVTKVSKGGQIPAFTFTPPSASYTPRPQFGYDVEAARKLMAEAGYPNGKGFKGFELLYNTSEDHRQIAEALQQMWKTALNIDVTLKNQEWKVYLVSTESGNYDLSRLSWGGDYLDPNSFLDMWVSSAGNNQTGWSNKKYDELIATANKTADPVKRMELFQEAEALLMTEVPIIPIYYRVSQVLKNPRVKGWYPTILSMHPWQHVYIEDK